MKSGLLSQSHHFRQLLWWISVQENCVFSLKQAQEDAFNMVKEKVKDHEWLKDFIRAGGLEVCALFH